ncbi:MAG: hypothetical protein M1838_004819 [Thelocarpon superellum]|nr:MAG: hypothetical protein M1838_004819 [Thelocarpon superellum]
MSTESTEPTAQAVSKEAPTNQAKIKLFWLEKSRSQRILWLLEELKLQYEIQTFKRLPEGFAPPELKEVHPLGKSPVISVQAGDAKPLVLAESGFIVEYLTEHFGPWLQPRQYAEGQERQIGGETEEWLRYRFYMHYAEGSLMALLVVGLIVSKIRNAPLPFFLKPITSLIAGKVEASYLHPNYKTHFDFLESQMTTSPGNGEYLCGKELTGADILMSFPLEAASRRAGVNVTNYPKLSAYLDRIYEREAYKKAVEKIVEIEGEFKPV